MLYICMLAVSMLPVSVIILFDVRIVPTMSYFLFFISLYIFCYFLIFLRLVDDDTCMFTFPVSSLASGLSWSTLLVSYFCLHLCYICVTYCVVPSMLVLSNLYKMTYLNCVLHWNRCEEFVLMDLSQFGHDILLKIKWKSHIVNKRKKRAYRYSNIS
jgi:hypothetical protein